MAQYESTAPGKTGPVLNSEIEEVQGIFPSDAALQDALSRLTLAGYDRADFSLPETSPAPGHATPNMAAANPNTDVDNVQVRNMDTSMAGTVGAFAAAAATLATGGAAALAAGAAVAAGIGVGAATHALHQAADTSQHENREARAKAGLLVLAVRIEDESEQREVCGIMQQAGATRVEPVRRVDCEVSSSSWTG